MHYPVDLLEEERFLPHTPWSTSAASLVLKGGPHGGEDPCLPDEGLGDASEGRFEGYQPPGLVPWVYLADPHRRGPWAGEVN